MIGRRAPVLVFLVLLPLGSLLCQDTFNCTAIETSGSTNVPGYTCKAPISSFSLTGSQAFQCGYQNLGPFVGVGNPKTSSVSANGTCVLGGAMGLTDCAPIFTPVDSASSGYLEGENRGWTGWCYTTSTVNGNTVTCSTQTCQCNDMDYEDGICSLCPSPTSPNPGSGYCCGGFTGGCSMYPAWNTENCDWQCQNVSPIILDVDGNGYHLTDATGGVLFDFFGNGQKIQMSWTAAGSTNAFLVLPDEDGAVPSGKQLFGNITPQPKCAGGRNGWNALVVYDELASGGNGNGMIDPGDEIFSKLRLWQDLNHDGIVQPNELFKLFDLGVKAISLHYTEEPWVDKYGNRFKYKGQVYGTKDSSLSRVAYDVFFTVQ